MRLKRTEKDETKRRSRGNIVAKRGGKIVERRWGENKKERVIGFIRLLKTAFREVFAFNLLARK